MLCATRSSRQLVAAPELSPGCMPWCAPRSCIPVSHIRALAPVLGLICSFSWRLFFPSQEQVWCVLLKFCPRTLSVGYSSDTNPCLVFCKPPEAGCFFWKWGPWADSTSKWLHYLFLRLTCTAFPDHAAQCDTTFNTFHYSEMPGTQFYCCSEGTWMGPNPPNPKLKVSKLQFLIVHIWPALYIWCSNGKINPMALIKHLLCLFLLLNYFIHTPSMHTSSSL